MALHLRDGESAATHLSATRAIWAGLAEQMRRRVVPHSPASSLEGKLLEGRPDGLRTASGLRHRLLELILLLNGKVFRLVRP